MKKVISLIAISVLITSIILLTPVSAQSNPDKFVPNRLLVKFNDDISKNKAHGILNHNNARVTDEISQIGVLVITVPDNAIDKVEMALRNNPNVEYVERDSIFDSQATPNDPEFSKQWHLSKIQAEKGWSQSIGNPNVVIAVLDTGFDSEHPDLTGKFVGGYNVYSNNYDWSPASCGHGTLVAGIVSASTNNGIGVAGVGWNNSILPIKVTGSDCYTSSSILAKGITYASDHGANVANISFSIYGGDRTITNAAKYMFNNGGLVVAASGNSGQMISGKDNPYIISVGATDSNDRIANFSSFGKYVDFSAPGVAVYTTCACSSVSSNSTGTYTSKVDYIYASGTSFSSPMVSGLVGLIMSANPNLTPSQVYDILKQSSTDLGTSGRDSYFGWGIIDINNALALT